MNREMMGVVMCGGQSLRMGSDKGMIMSRGITWSMLAFNKLSEIGIPVIISINASQAANYKKNFPADKLLIDSVEVEGPLKGILSVHKNFPRHDLMLLACDMKDMSTECLAALYRQWMRQWNEYDCFLYRNEGEYEPLAGIYSARLLSEIFLPYVRKESSDYSLKALIRRAKVSGLEVSPQMKARFRNFNSLLELQDHNSSADII